MADMTPAAWLELMDRRLTDRWAKWRILDDYYNGRQPLVYATAKFREAFGSLLQAMADNWCPLVVSTKVQRLKVQGFRFGAEERADEDAWAIWQANGLDADAGQVHTEAVKLGEAYWLVAPPERDGGMPVITAEHPSEMIVATAPGNRRLRLAAFKRWLGDDGYVYATLYLPDQLVKWRSAEKAKNGYVPGRIQWRRREDDPGGRNPLGVVPVVPICNNPSMLGGGQSDLAPLIPIFDAINKLCADMLVASEYAAYRQRVMTGVEQPKDPITGKLLPIEMGITRLLTVEAPDAKVFDLAASDLANYIGAIEMFVMHGAAQSNTPPHYLLGKMDNISGDALTAAESGLHSNIEDKQTSFGEGHEDTVRLAFRAMGDEDRADALDAETIWANAERRSFAQVVDGASKLAQMGMPAELVMEELGWSPQKIARAQVMRATQDLFDTAQVPPAGQDGTSGGQ